MNDPRTNKVYCTRNGSFVYLDRGLFCLAYEMREGCEFRNCYTCVHRGEVDPETGIPTEETLSRVKDNMEGPPILAMDIRRWGRV